MTVRVGINGFGRIGRNFYRALLEQQAQPVLKVQPEPQAQPGPQALLVQPEIQMYKAIY